MSRGYRPEMERVQFVIDRDGQAGAIEFVQRGLKAYRRFSRPKTTEFGRKIKQFPHDKLYRALYVESILYWKAFLRANDTKRESMK